MAQISHKSWLKVTAVVIASFGPVFFLSTMIGTAGPSRITLDILSWPNVFFNIAILLIGVGPMWRPEATLEEQEA